MLDVLKQMETQSVPPLVSDGKVRKDKVSGRLWSIEIGDSGNSDTGQYWHDLTMMHAALGNGTSDIQTGVQHEASIVFESNVFTIFEDRQFHDRWWIDGTTISRSWTCQQE